MARISYELGTRYVTIYDSKGRRIRGSRTGAWRSWGRGSGQKFGQLFKQAVIAAVNHALRTKTGTIIFRRKLLNNFPTLQIVRLFQVKIGTDGKIFMSYYKPEGERLRKKLSLPEKFVWRA